MSIGRHDCARPLMPDKDTAGAMSILVVHDDGTLRDRVADALRNRGYQVTTADGTTEALEGTDQASFKCVIVDLRSGGCSALHVAVKLKREMPDLRVIMLTGYASVESAVAAMRISAHDDLSKPFEADDVIATFASAGLAAAHGPARSKTLARIEWEHVQRVLVECDGNKSETARHLGITRRTLQRKLKLRPPSQ